MAVGQNVCLRLTTRGDAPGYDEDGLWPKESMVFDQKDNRYTATSNGASFGASIAVVLLTRA